MSCHILTESGYSPAEIDLMRAQARAFVEAGHGLDELVDVVWAEEYSAETDEFFVVVSGLTTPVALGSDLDPNEFQCLCYKLADLV